MGLRREPEELITASWLDFFFFFDFALDPFFSFFTSFFFVFLSLPFSWSLLLPECETAQSCSFQSFSYYFLDADKDVSKSRSYTNLAQNQLQRHVA